MWFDEFATPIGKLTVAVDDTGVRHVLFATNAHPVPSQEEWKRDKKATRDVREQLLDYFAGNRKGFDLPINPVGTPFQRKVWKTLVRIPYGQTWSYGELASKVGRPAAARAVGTANGRNPLPILLPCHRVVGSDGSLTGFSGGLPAKVWLLSHEGAGTYPLFG
jgi:methylated-DNA-[protein]-cysteine S-methyltransferase